MLHMRVFRDFRRIFSSAQAHESTHKMRPFLPFANSQMLRTGKSSRTRSAMRTFHAELPRITEGVGVVWSESPMGSRFLERKAFFSSGRVSSLFCVSQPHDSRGRALGVRLIELLVGMGLGKIFALSKRVNGHFHGQHSIALIPFQSV